MRKSKRPAHAAPQKPELPTCAAFQMPEWPGPVALQPVRARPAAHALAMPARCAHAKQGPPSRCGL
eukprot:2903331-Alexandrium_andersonii.AAC.1